MIKLIKKGSTYALLLQIAYSLFFGYRFLLDEDWISALLVIGMFSVPFLLGVWWATLSFHELMKKESACTSDNWINLQ